MCVWQSVSQPVSMDPLMRAQVALLGEAASADAAAVRPLARVHALVHLQVAEAVKALPAERADEPLLPHWHSPLDNTPTPNTTTAAAAASAGSAFVVVDDNVVVDVVAVVYLALHGYLVSLEAFILRGRWLQAQV